jgi:hypothetical protein
MPDASASLGHACCVGVIRACLMRRRQLMANIGTGTMKNKTSDSKIFIPMATP